MVLFAAEFDVSIEWVLVGFVIFGLLVAALVTFLVWVNRKTRE